MNNTNQTTNSLSNSKSNDCSTQTNPLEMVEVKDGLAMVPIDTMLDMLDCYLGSQSVTSSANDELLPLSTLKMLINQLNSKMESYQNGQLNSVENTSVGENPQQYLVRRLKGTIESLKCRIKIEESK
jgi:hypothetical protein